MSKCLRCGSGNEWIEPVSKSRSMTPKRRTVRLPHTGEVFEFGPLWWKWWHRLTKGGRWHWVITGESCILHEGHKRGEL